MKRYDVAVVGSGPAGLSAALNAAIRNKDVVVFGPDISEKLRRTPKIDNYPGLPGVSGAELIQAFRAQVDPLVERRSEDIRIVYDMGEVFGLLTSKDEIVEAYSVVLAIGTNLGKPVPGEREFLGRGAGTCATCDAALYRGRPVVVVGYNEHSVEEARFISEVASDTVFVNRLGREVSLPERIRVVADRVVELKGDTRARELVLGKETLKADGFFFIRDAAPVDQLVPGLASDGAHIIVDRGMRTNIEGLFAAGDVTGEPYQISVACGEGQIAGLNAAHFATKRKRQQNA